MQISCAGPTLDSDTGQRTDRQRGAQIPENVVAADVHNHSMPNASLPGARNSTASTHVKPAIVGEGMIHSRQKGTRRRSRLRRIVGSPLSIGLLALAPAGPSAVASPVGQAMPFTGDHGQLTPDHHDVAIGNDDARQDDIVVAGRASPRPGGRVGDVVTTVDRDAFVDSPAVSVVDALKRVPGVVVSQGNGPRDVAVSVRGSNARNGFGARNLRVFEDDFPVTAADGLTRFELMDPHAYRSIDVVRGPSSARYGDYALDGVIDFHLRQGRDIQGVETGIDVGGNGFANPYAAVGAAGPRYDYSVFGSIAAADGVTGHTGYRTGNIDALATVELGTGNRVTGKFIYSAGDIDLSTRLSLDQYSINPFQAGCAHAASAAPGCGTVSILANGVNGARIAQTAAEAALGRHDERTVAGLRYSHDIGAVATWRTQVTVDGRAIDQALSATPVRATLDNVDLTSDLTLDHRIAGIAATSFVAVFGDTLAYRSANFNKRPGGREAVGAQTQTMAGHVGDFGGRARIELRPAASLALVAGLGAEQTAIAIDQIGYSYPVGGATTSATILARRQFLNLAEEAGITWRPNAVIAIHGRIATGYGIPQIGSLFVTPSGVAGNNTALETQGNTGIDLGAELSVRGDVKLAVTGYADEFRNEQVSQSAGANLLPYVSNAPRSRHRGIETGIDVRLRHGRWNGLRFIASYGYSDNRYTDFTEHLSSDRTAVDLDRAGKRIPGVVPVFASAKLGYDVPSGACKGLGGFLETTHGSGYFIDNGNILAVPPYTLVNATIHYDPPSTTGWGRRVTIVASVQNLFDEAYVGGASAVTDGLTATGLPTSAAGLGMITGTIYAGTPRTVFLGIKTRF